MKSTSTNKLKLGNEPIKKLLYKMSIPMILAMLINGMYWALSLEVPHGGAMAELKGNLVGWEGPDTH